MLHDREVILAGEVDRFFAHLDRDFPVLAVIDDLQQQIARMAITERAILREIVRFQQILNYVGLEFDLQHLAHDREQLDKVLRGRIGHFNLVRNSS